jgi:phosphatidylglycerol:prolipoprotein diacylglycerol transferase
MDPLLFSIGPIKIFWFGVMTIVGYSAALSLVVWMGRKEGKDFSFCADLSFWLMISGIVGARLTYIAANWGHYASRLNEIWRIDQGGLIYYGGMIAGLVTVVVFAKVRRHDVRRLFDFIAVGVPLAHAFGRVGCFLNGCCHGKVYDGLLAVRFPYRSPVWYRQLELHRIDTRDPESLPVHPVQIYEAVFNLAVCVFLVWVYRRRKRAGTTTALYLICYPVGRFVLEFFRGDQRLTFLGMNTAQVTSLAVLAAGILLLTFGRGKAPEEKTAAARHT